MEIELRLLRCALALAEHCNFARAAKAAHMSQPSLSRNIQELELRLGVALFTRNQGGVEPTAAGVILLEQAAEVLSRSNDLVREMDLLRGLQKGELNIGAGIYPGPMFVDRAVGRLIRDHPAARVSLDYDHAINLFPRLLKREFDLTVIYVAVRGVDAQVHVTRLKPHQIYFVARAGHPIHKLRRTPSLADILHYPLTTTSGTPPTLVRRFRAATAKQPVSGSHGLTSIPSVSCESLAMMKPIVEESDTVALLPLNVVFQEIENGTMVVLPFFESWLHISFAIVRLAHRSLSPLGEKFAQLAMESDAELAQFEQQAVKTLFSRRKA